MEIWTCGAIDCTISIGNTTFNTANTQSSSSPYPFADSTLSNKDFFKSELSIYPNLINNGIVNIDSTLTEAENVELFNLIGRTVLKAQLNSDVLDVRSLSAGIYLLKVSIDNRTTTTKK